jgi:hypothetical protein
VEFLVATFLGDFAIHGLEPEAFHILLIDVGGGVVVVVVGFSFEAILGLEGDIIVRAEEFVEGQLADGSFRLLELGLGHGLSGQFG